jgi:hypothetical protein
MYLGYFLLRKPIDFAHFGALSHTKSIAQGYTLRYRLPTLRAFGSLSLTAMGIGVWHKAESKKIALNLLRL